MSPHRAVIEAGPGAIRRLCCGADVVADTAVSAAALAAIDDQVALLDERPVAVDSLWFDALRSVAVDHRDGPVVVHPSWWSAARVEVVTAAARTLTRDVVVHPRSWLLRQASSGVSAATVVVEIAERLVLVAGAEVAAVARRTDAESVAGQVGSVIARMTRGITAVVLIDVPVRSPGRQRSRRQSPVRCGVPVAAWSRSTACGWRGWPGPPCRLPTSPPIRRRGLPPALGSRHLPGLRPPVSPWRYWRRLPWSATVRQPCKDHRRRFW